MKIQRIYRPSEYCRGDIDIRLCTLFEDGKYGTILGGSAGEINQTESAEKFR